jgi:hypothetical protein
MAAAAGGCLGQRGRLPKKKTVRVQIQSTNLASRRVAMSGRQWSVKLVGETGHLKLLASIFTENPAWIVLTNEEYYLGGSFLGGCVEAREAVRDGEAKLRLMIGAARIETGFDELQSDVCGVVCCREANGSSATILVAEACSLEIGSNAISWTHRPGLSRDYLAAAEGNAHLKLALKLWADTDRIWPRLYRIAEEIYVSFRNRKDEHPSEVLFRSGLVDSKEDYLRFANSANDARYAGTESRHAMGKNKMPKEVGKLGKKFLSHAEAVSLVRECLKRALGHRANPPG